MTWVPQEQELYDHLMRELDRAHAMTPGGTGPHDLHWVMSPYWFNAVATLPVVSWHFMLREPVPGWACWLLGYTVTVAPQYGLPRLAAMSEEAPVVVRTLTMRELMTR